MAVRFCKLKQYCPTADLFSLYHTRETAFLDSSLTNKYGNYSIIGLYSYKAIFISAGTMPLKKPMSVIMLLSIISKQKIIYNQINKISTFS